MNISQNVKSNSIKTLVTIVIAGAIGLAFMAGKPRTYQCDATIKDMHNLEAEPVYDTAVVQDHYLWFNYSISSSDVINKSGFMFVGFSNLMGFSDSVGQSSNSSGGYIKHAKGTDRMYMHDNLTTMSFVYLNNCKVS